MNKINIKNGKNVGAVLAGGTGERFGADIPKQFVSINHKMIIEYTIENLCNASRIDEIYLAINPKYWNIGEKLQEKYPKIRKLVKGGKTRNESIYNVIISLEENVEKVIFIDAVRPFVSSHIFDAFVELLENYEVVKFCSKIVDYIVEIDNSLIKKVLNRNIMRLCSAPVGYRRATLQQMASKVSSDQFNKFESDLEIVLRLFPDIKIFSYESNEFNFKITYKKDLDIANALLTK